MTIETTCKGCGEEYRLKDAAAGKTLNCKVCGAKIRVPEESEDFDSDFDDDDRDEDLKPRRKGKRSNALGRLMPPCIVLAALSALSVLLNIVILLFVITHLNELDDGPPPDLKPEAVTGYYIGYYIGAFGPYTAGTIVNIVVLIGAIAGCRGRSYGLAMTALVLGCFPCCGPLFGLGIPFAIWGLVVINDERVSSAFQ